MKINRTGLKILYICCALIVCISLYATFRLIKSHSNPIQSVATHSIYLLGDAGNLKRNAADLFTEVLNSSKSTSLVIFLGDNIYSKGLRPPEHSSHSKDLAKLYAQIELVKDKASKSIFVPGNHDWGSFSKNGYSPEGASGILRQSQVVIDSLGAGSFAPVSACPGPEISTFNGMSVMAIDTQWLLFNNQNKSPQEGCPDSNKGFYNDFARLLPSSPSILIGHHPLESDGRHSGGSGARCSQNLGCDIYREMRQKLKSILQTNPPLICAAGHDHSLQILKGDAACRYYIVSGAMSHLTSVKTTNRQYFSTNDGGFMRIDFYDDSVPVINVFTTTSGARNPAYSMELH